MLSGQQPESAETGDEKIILVNDSSEQSDKLRRLISQTGCQKSLLCFDSHTQAIEAIARSQMESGSDAVSLVLLKVDTKADRDTVYETLANLWEALTCAADAETKREGQAFFMSRIVLLSDLKNGRTIPLDSKLRL